MFSVGVGRVRLVLSVTCANRCTEICTVKDKIHGNRVLPFGSGVPDAMTLHESNFCFWMCLCEWGSYAAKNNHVTAATITCAAPGAIMSNRVI
jgi:hypothetical protein